MTVALQEAILLAAEKSRRSGGKGLVGYLTNLANDRPKVFGPLLVKLMTLQEKQLAKTKQEPAKPVAHMSDAEVAAALIARGWPKKMIDSLFVTTPIEPAERDAAKKHGLQ